MDSSENTSVEAKISQIMEMANSDDSSTQRFAFHQICTTISSSDDVPLIERFISFGCIPIIVACLSSDEELLRYESIKALKKVVSLTYGHTETIVNAGALQSMIKLLSSGNIEISRETISVLGIITENDPHPSEQCLELAILPSLLADISPSVAVDALSDATKVIVNLCKVKTIRRKSMREIVLALARLINHHDPQILLNTLSTFHTLTEEFDYDRNRVLVDTGVVPNLVPLLAHTDANIQLAALKVLGNIVAGLDEHAQLILDHGILQRMPLLLTHSRKDIARGAMWLLSNITCATERQIQEVLNSGLMPIVISLLNKENHSSLREAIWTVVNIMQYGTPQQVQELVRLGVIAPVCSLLDCNKQERVQLIVEGISGLLQKIGKENKEVYFEIEKCGGLARIEALGNHENMEIAMKAKAIVEYFSSVEMKSVTDSLDHVQIDNNAT